MHVVWRSFETTKRKQQLLICLLLLTIHHIHYWVGVSSSFVFPVAFVSPRVSSFLDKNKPWLSMSRINEQSSSPKERGELFPNAKQHRKGSVNRFTQNSTSVVIRPPLLKFVRGLHLLYTHNCNINGTLENTTLENDTKFVDTNALLGNEESDTHAFSPVDRKNGSEATLSSTNHTANTSSNLATTNSTTQQLTELLAKMHHKSLHDKADDTRQQANTQVKADAAAEMDENISHDTQQDIYDIASFTLMPPRPSNYDPDYWQRDDHDSRNFETEDGSQKNSANNSESNSDLKNPIGQRELTFLEQQQQLQRDGKEGKNHNVHQGPDSRQLHKDLEASKLLNTSTLSTPLEEKPLGNSDEKSTSLANDYLDSLAVTPINNTQQRSTSIGGDVYFEDPSNHTIRGTRKDLFHKCLNVTDAPSSYNANMSKFDNNNDNSTNGHAKNVLSNDLAEGKQNQPFSFINDSPHTDNLDSTHTSRGSKALECKSHNELKEFTPVKTPKQQAEILSSDPCDNELTVNDSAKVNDRPEVHGGAEEQKNDGMELSGSDTAVTSDPTLATTVDVTNPCQNVNTNSSKAKTNDAPRSGINERTPRDVVSSDIAILRETAVQRNNSSDLMLAEITPHEVNTSHYCLNENGTSDDTKTTNETTRSADDETQIMDRASERGAAFLRQHGNDELQQEEQTSEEEIAAKYAAIPSLEERAFTILKDLGLVEITPDPDDPEYDHSRDDEYS